MLLSQAGVPVHPDALIDAVYVPEKKGSFAPELKAAARKLGRLPYEIDPSLTALTRALTDGYPVLILQNLGLGFYPKWHFAVTIGIDRGNNNFILRSGPDRRHVISMSRFERRWRLGDYWAIVLFKPDNFPTWINQDQYEEQFALMETEWHEELETIYSRLQARWPDSTMASLGLGNIAYNANDLELASEYYQQTLGINPSHIAALHNLAQIRYDTGDYKQAADLVCKAKNLAQGHPLQSYLDELENNLQQIDSAPVCVNP